MVLFPPKGASSGTYSRLQAFQYEARRYQEEKEEVPTLQSKTTT
jgi:hypothetical protein